MYHHRQRNPFKRFGVISIIGGFLGSYAQILIDSAWLKSGFGLFLLGYGLSQFIPS